MIKHSAPVKDQLLCCSRKRGNVAVTNGEIGHSLLQLPSCLKVQPGFGSKLECQSPSKNWSGIENLSIWVLRILTHPHIYVSEMFTHISLLIYLTNTTSLL